MFGLLKRLFLWGSLAALLFAWLKKRRSENPDTAETA